MTRKWMIAISGILAIAGVAGLFALQGASGSLAAQPWRTDPVSTEVPKREADGGGNSPAISFIDSPNPTCYVAEPGTGACLMDWGYLYVAASSGQYIISMTVAIDGQLQAYHSGFFQNSIYIPGDMAGPGYRVSCGAPGSGGNPILGASHAYTLRARDSSGLRAANYGSVSCPPDLVRVFLPVLARE